MQKWEYVRWYWMYESNHSSHGKFESIGQMMAAYGKEGWELISAVADISAVDITNGYGDVVGKYTESLGEIYFFKCPIE